MGPSPFESSNDACARHCSLRPARGSRCTATDTRSTSENGTWRTAQLDRADKAALWATIVDLDLPGRSMIEPADVAAEDEVVNTILVASGNGTLIEHEVVVGVDGPHGPLGELLVEVASLTDRLDGTSWTTETWIGPTSGGCIDYAEPPTSGPEFELRQPVMPDMSSWTFDQITYGAGCAN